MKELTSQQVLQRERTLRNALLLSMWAPLATGVAVLLSRSLTQQADFIRRTVELIALFVSWRIFRLITRNPDITSEHRCRLERLAGFCVAGTMGLSGMIMLAFTFMERSSFQPGGNVYPGLLIALLGLGVNGWFWRRYVDLNREQHHNILDAQRRLYRAKALVDLGVIIALGSVVLLPTLPVTAQIDFLGSTLVAGYLLWSAAATFRSTVCFRSESDHPTLI